MIINEIVVDENVLKKVAENINYNNLNETESDEENIKVQEKRSIQTFIRSDNNEYVIQFQMQCNLILCWIKFVLV